MVEFENMEELLNDFFDESFDLISKMESAILELEKDKSNREMINEIFRAAHTIKGSSATLQLDDIASFAHLFEDTLDFIRSHPELEINSTIVDIILEGIDTLKQMLEAKYNNKKIDIDLSDIEDKLYTISAMFSDDKKKQDKKRVEKEKVDYDKLLLDFKISEKEFSEISGSFQSDENIYLILVFFSEDDPMATVGPIQVYSSLRDLGKVLKSFPEFDKLQENIFFEYVIYLYKSIKSKEVIKEFINIPDTVTDIYIKELKIEDLKDLVIQETDIKEEKESEDIDDQQEIKIEVKESSKETKKESKETQKEKAKNIQEEKIKKPDSDKKVSIKPKTILRVDSARIDELLNLVSQIVINKATLYESFNRLGNLTEVESIIDEYFQTNFENSEIEEKGIDYLLDRVSNLQNKINTFFKNFKILLDDVKNELQVHSRIINSLQEGVMKIRMVPINQLFTRFPRIIRDLSKKLNKKVELILEGEDTELDKSIIEELTDPLMHIVRNAMDHGIETPDERKKAGKPEKGVIKVSARNEGNIIYIEIEDDGKGIDPEVIRKKAIERNLISPDEILTLNDIYNLLFLPGFSTSERVSDVSGRGVGMDVVKKAIEKLSGSILIESKVGEGTKITIKLPLTLAIIQALMVYVGDEIYAIPINSIFETRRIEENEILKIEDKDVIKIRDEVISLIFLDKVFKVPKSKKENFNYYIVVVGIGRTKIGLVVDALIEEQDIVIKPLNNKMIKVPGIAGAAILGNGDISLIIDINQLVEYQKSIDKSTINIINEEIL